MNIPVFLASDDNYAPFVASTIASMCDNTKSFVDFYILDGGISCNNKKRIDTLQNKFNNCSIEFIHIDLEKEFNSIDYSNGMNYITLSTYSRFLIPQLKPCIGKAFYSDVDVIAMGDISEIYNENLGGYSLGAVAELYLETSSNIERKSRLLLSDSHKYFCAGGLLIDSEKWREEETFVKLLDIEKKQRDNIVQADQDVLNIYYNNNYKVLKPEYGVMDIFYDFHNIEKPVIRHFHGKYKPWHFSPDLSIESLMPNHKDFWKYLKMTEFYDEVLSKASDKNQQSELLRKFKISKIMSKNSIKKTW